MRFNSFKIGKIKEKHDRDTAGAGDILTTQIASLEKQVNNKTKELEATEQKLKELSNMTKDSEKDKDTSSRPHGPLDELSLKPADELLLLDEETDVSTLLGEANVEEVKVVEVVGGAAAPAKAEKAETENQPAVVEESDSLRNLFGQEEEEENPLANLIGSLPDVTAQELLDELGEIKEIIKEWQQN